MISITRPLRPRLLALTAALRQATARQGAMLVDFGADPAASDPRLWSVDRLHANQAGHARIAARFAAALGLPDRDASPATAVLPAARPRPHAAPGRRAGLVRRYLAPWVVRRLRRRSSGDGRLPKRSELLPVAPPTERPRVAALRTDSGAGVELLNASHEAEPDARVGSVAPPSRSGSR